MIDLHLHLDGSLSEEDFTFLSRKDGVNLGKDFPHNIYVPDNCPSLEEYLKRFDLPLLLMQKADDISYVTRSLVLRLAKMGFIYAEIRFAPLLHQQQGLSIKEAAMAAIKGLKEGLHMTRGFDANLILCCMRHAREEENLETVRVAKQLRHQKVVAVDLAGAEALHPSSFYKNVFDLAKKYKLNITIHAGEATGSDEIMMALDNGATRIGHGVHLCLDRDSVVRVKEEKVCFEFCPTSNLQTKSLKSYQDVPLRQFIEKDIDVTINSDNMTVSHTDAIQEMRHMVKTFNLSKAEVEDLLKNSINHAFISSLEKRRLLRKLSLRINNYYEQLLA